MISSSSLTSLSSSLSFVGRRKTSSLSRRKGIVVQQCKNRNVVTNHLIKDGDDEDDDRSSSAPNEKLMMMQAVSVAPFLVFSPKAFAAGAFDSVSNAFSSPEFHELSMYTLKTLISWGVPAVTVGIVALMIISGARRVKSSSSGGEDGSSSSSPFGFLRGGQMGKKPRTQPYLSIKRLNDRLDSYALQFEAATVSKTSAKRQQNKQRFEKR